MDKPEFICMGCGRDLGSKFALKTHKRICSAAPTGRFKPWSEPNMQNIPVRAYEGQAIRDAFADKVELASRDTKYHRFVNK